jgi:thiol-disulfide isomerase/thioredoxin
MRTAARISIALALWCGIALQIAKPETPEGVCSAHAKVADLHFTFKDIHGNPVTLSDYKGKVVLLDFWATWCPPCRKEMPDLESLLSDPRHR